MILDIVARYVDLDAVLFITSNGNDTPRRSADIDIYCVTSGGTSSVHLFAGEDVWIELFVDVIDDLRLKLENCDEIAVNFLHELSFVSGDRKLHAALRAETAALRHTYRLPPHRQNLLKYRIAVLLSKYRACDEEDLPSQAHLLLNAMSFPLIQLALERHGLFPGSPKIWLAQLREAIPPPDFDALERFLAHRTSAAEVERLCETYAGGLEPIHIEKVAGQNRITALS